MRIRDITEGVGRITKQNQTVDVGPDEVTKQAAKFGNKVDKDGRPPTLSKKVKGKSTNVLFNLGLAEGYKLQLERDKELLVLNITDTKTGKRTEVRGKPGYETGGYDPNDSLHILLDKVGKSVDISQLMNGEPVGINPKHPTGADAKTATDKAYSENFVKDSATAIKLIKKYHQTGDEQDAFAAIKHGWNFIKNPKMRSIIVNLVKKVSTENGLPDWDRTVAYIKKNTGIDVSNVNENFADGKVKGKSRPVEEGFFKSKEEKQKIKDRKLAIKKHKEIQKYVKRKDAYVPEVTKALASYFLKALEIKDPSTGNYWSDLHDSIIGMFGHMKNIQSNEVVNIVKSIHNAVRDPAWSMVGDDYRSDKWKEHGEFIKAKVNELMNILPNNAIDEKGKILDPLMLHYWAKSHLGHYNSSEIGTLIKTTLNTLINPNLENELTENFADGKVKGKSRPGRVKKSGASCNGSVTALRKRAKNASGEKAKMYHWCANMKGGKK